MELVFDFGKGRIEWTQNLFPKRQRILDPRSSHGDEGAAASEGDGTAGGPAPCGAPLPPWPDRFLIPVPKSCLPPTRTVASWLPGGECDSFLFAQERTF